MVMRTIIERYANLCVSEWEEVSLLELADAYTNPGSTLNTADLAQQLEEALELSAGALSAYVVD
jgi:hypothetical protein